MMAAINNLAISNSAILVFPPKLTHTGQDWFPPFPKKKKLHSLFPLYHLHKILHSYNLINLMMAAILNSAILDSAILNKTLTQTNSIWLKLLHSDSTWWWQPSWILPSWIQPFYTKNFTHSFWLNFMMAAIFNLAILDSVILVFLLKLTHTCQDWFPPFAQKKLHSFILTQLNDGSYLEFCHVGFRHCHLGFRHQSDSESN